MRTSFKNTVTSNVEQVAPTQDGVTVDAKTQPESSTAITVREDRPLVQYVDETDARGEFDSSDIERAFLTIVAKTGKLSNIFTPGDLLLNKENVIGGSKNPVQVTAIEIEKWYKQDLSMESDELGNEVTSAMEVLDLGGVLEYRPYEDKTSTHYWKPILRVLFLVKKPAAINPEAASLFSVTIGGDDYATVGYTAHTKTAYNGIAKPLITLKQRQGSVRARTWNLTTKGETWEDKSWVQVNLRSVGETSLDVLDYLKANHG